MIEERVRGLVDEVMSTTDSCGLKQQIDQIGELDRAVNMLQAVLSVESAAFAEARRCEDLAMGGSWDTAGRGAAAEIGLARRVSKATVDHHLAFAEPLVAEHPELLAACLAGTVSQPAAKHVVKEAEVLDPEQRRALDPELTELAMTLTPGQAQKAAARLVAAADPDAAVKRARAARARKQVRALVNGDATGTLIANLPVEQAVACWDALDHHARNLRSDGDPRSIRELVCDLFVERITGQTHATNLNLEVGVVVAASSLLGVDDQPGKLVGHRGGDYGTLPAEVARDLAASTSAWWRRLVCDPIDGRLTSMDTRKRRYGGMLRTFLIYRDATSRRPCSDTPIYDIDHITRFADGGPTTAANGQGLAKSDHTLRDLPGWNVHATDGDAANGVTWQTPTGHTYESKPPPILGHGNRRPRRRRPPPPPDDDEPS